MEIYFICNYVRQIKLFSNKLPKQIQPAMGHGEEWPKHQKYIQNNC